ncbi:MAG: DUF3575 domain-containing protein [Candidatus Cryptobacteroides sp.]
MKHVANIVKVTVAVIAATILSCALSPNAGAQQVAVKTNALYWAALSPNFGVEIVTGEHSSIDFSVMGHYKPYGLNSKLFTFQPEYRYWFNGRPMIREYIGASALVATYDMGFGDYLYKGNAYSVGITGGYVFALNKHWNLELCAGFSFLFFHQKQYCKHDNYDDYYIDTTVQANAWGYKLFPAKLGVTFSYIIK